MLTKQITLSNGVTIPILGLGTWLIKDDAVEQVVLDALEVGYRHIDTAQVYGNESGVGRGIHKSLLKREEIFITSKVDADIKDYETAKASIEKSLELMGVEYIDLMLIHGPQPWLEFRSKNRYFEENIQVWKALEEAYKIGKVRAIGVSNFLKDDLENLVKHVEIKPMVNQILTHISNTSFDLIEFCQKQDIVVEAYSPMGHGAILDHPVIQSLADKYQKSVPAICIRYVLQLNTIALPKTKTKAHMLDNADVDFVISDEDMEMLKQLESITDYGKDDKFLVFKRGIWEK